MKGRFKFVISACTMGIAFALAWSSQAQVIFHPPRPTVVAPPVAPVVVAPVFPQSYVWDGSQFVGWIGNQYFFLAPGNVWMPMDPVRLRHWNSWTRTNPKWRNRAVRNTRYRNMSPAWSQPTRSGGPPRSGRSNGPWSNQNQPPQNQGRGNRSGRGSSRSSGPPPKVNQGPNSPRPNRGRGGP